MRDSIPGPWGHTLSPRQMLSRRAPRGPKSLIFIELKCETPSL